MSRLIRADLLKLCRRTGMLGVVAFIVFGSVLVYFGADLFLDSSADFETATGVLTAPFPVRPDTVIGLSTVLLSRIVKSVPLV